MEKIVLLFAPRFWWDFLLRFVGILLAINLFDYSLSLVVPERLGMVHSTALTSLVAVPFVFVFLLVLRHQHDLQARLRHLSETDQLTNLANRRAFLSKAGGAALSGDMVLMILDIDYFKSVNDRFGHEVGDRCLQRVSRRLEQLVGEMGTVARIGGEEFGVLLPGATRQQAETIASIASAGFALPLPPDPGGPNERLCLSAGAAHGQAGQMLTEVMRLADRALYAAKNAGRARLVYANASEISAAEDAAEVAIENAAEDAASHVHRREQRDPGAAALGASLSPG